MIITDVLVISATMSVLILLMIIASKMFGKNFKAKYKYMAWFLIALRLCIPAKIDFADAPIDISPEDTQIVLNVPTADVGHEDVNKQDDTISEQLDADTGNTDAHPQTHNNTQKREMITISLAFVLHVVWLAGMFVFIIYHALSLVVFRIRIKKHTVQIYRDVYRCAAVDSPMMTGFFRPQILVPDEEIAQDELDLIIKHEMAHFRRHDIWYKLILLIANSVHWFNPIIYIMVKCAERDLEYACDDYVTRGMDLDSKKKYSLTILRFMRKD